MGDNHHLKSIRKICQILCWCREYGSNKGQELKFCREIGS
jgi:hypothetical protein